MCNDYAMWSVKNSSEVWIEQRNWHPKFFQEDEELIKTWNHYLLL